MPTWGVSRWGWFVVIAILVAMPWVGAPSTARAASTSPPFPRLATLFSKTNMGSDGVQRSIARNNLYVTDMVNWPLPSAQPGKTIGQYLKALNPSLTALLYLHSVIQSDLATDYYAPAYTVGGVTYYIDPRWFLTYAGSTLRASAAPSDTSIAVQDLSPFAVGDRVLLGGLSGQSAAELAIVVSKSAASGAGSLELTRGVFSQGGKFPAAAHNAGDYVRPVAHAFGTASWMVLNPTSSALASNVNSTLGSETWDQFLASFIHAKLADPGFSTIDGIFLDNFVDKATDMVDTPARVDADNSNRPSGMTDQAWSAGMLSLASNVRGAIPASMPLMGNSGGDSPSTFGQYLNGGLIEGIDQNGASMEGSTAGALAYASSWLAGGRAPQTFIVNGSPRVSGLSAGASSFQAMRFLLTLTLTGDGYFSFDDVNVDGGHQSVWWFDEYDNAGQGTGYLGQALGPATQPAGGVYRRDFANGVSLSNTSQQAQVVSLGGTFRKIKGSQAPSINDGSLVTSVTLQPNDGIILLRTSPTPTPTASVTSTATSTPSPSATATVPQASPTPPGGQPSPTATPVVPTSTPTVASAKPASAAVPAAPSGLRAVYNNGGVDLQWSASNLPGVTYTLYRGPMPGRETRLQTGIAGNTDHDGTIQPGAVYWYRVTAVNAVGESAPSGDVMVFVPASTSTRFALPTPAISFRLLRHL